jgi:hypothetical protein
MPAPPRLGMTLARAVTAAGWVNWVQNLSVVERSAWLRRPATVLTSTHAAP